MRSRVARKITTAATAASIFVLVAPVTAMASADQPSVVRPMTGVGCYSGTSYGEGQECTEVVGSGLKVTSISGEFNNTTPFTATIYIDFYGPNGHITNTGNLTVASGKSTGYHTWHNPNPNANMTPGDYCTEAFLAGSNLAFWSDCIQVHT